MMKVNAHSERALQRAQVNPTTRLLEHMQAVAGSDETKGWRTSVQLASFLGMSPSVVQAILRALVLGGMIDRRSNRLGTTYFRSFSYQQRVEQFKR